MQGVSKGGFGPVVNQAYVGGEQPPDNRLSAAGIEALGAGSHRSGGVLPAPSAIARLHDRGGTGSMHALARESSL